MPNMVLDKSFEQLNGLYETCYNGNAMETFLKSLVEDDVLNMEDDIILCSNFLEEVNKWISKYPYKVITFFTLKDISKSQEMIGRTFCMAQCVYIPKWFNKCLIKYYDYWKKTKKGIENPTGLDYMVADMMTLMNEKYILVSPCLVQHMEMKSRINPRRSTKRQAKYFKG